MCWHELTAFSFGKKNYRYSHIHFNEIFKQTWFLYHKYTVIPSSNDKLWHYFFFLFLFYTIFMTQKASFSISQDFFFQLNQTKHFELFTENTYHLQNFVVLTDKKSTIIATSKMTGHDKFLIYFNFYTLSWTINQILISTKRWFATYSCFTLCIFSEMTIFSIEKKV